MSRTLTFWKEGPRLTASHGAVALGIGECEIEGLEALDEARLLELIEQRFHGWAGEQLDRWSFECDVHGMAMTLTLRDRTPAEVEAWFRELARREGLTVFDDAVDEITIADEREHRGRVAAAERELEEEELLESRRELERLLPLAEAGDPAAQCAVGQKLSFGEGVARDSAAAATWYERAARAGNVDAMVNLAALLRNGRGVPRDPRAAATWLERALPHDGLFAPFELGQMYAAGEGIARDVQRAEELFRRALASGHPEARKALRLLGEKP